MARPVSRRGSNQKFDWSLPHWPKSAIFDKDSTSDDVDLLQQLLNKILKKRFETEMAYFFAKMEVIEIVLKRDNNFRHD